MAKWMEYPIGDKAVPIDLTINNTAGGDPGEIASIQIRRVSDDYYLDFYDQTFKLSGHIQISETVPPKGSSGRYLYTWDSSIAITQPTTVLVEYLASGPDTFGIDNDTIVFTNSATILERISKSPCGSVGQGSGGCRFLYTVTNQDKVTPIADVNVYVTTDVAGNTIVAGPILTNASGQVLFYLNSGVQYYLWRSKSGYVFTNPDLQKF